MWLWVIQLRCFCYSLNERGTRDLSMLPQYYVKRQTTKHLKIFIFLILFAIESHRTSPHFHHPNTHSFHFARNNNSRVMLAYHTNFMWIVFPIMSQVTKQHFPFNNIYFSRLSPFIRPFSISDLENFQCVYTWCGLVTAISRSF